MHARRKEKINLIELGTQYAIHFIHTVAPEAVAGSIEPEPGWLGSLLSYWIYRSLGAAARPFRFELESLGRVWVWMSGAGTGTGLGVRIDRDANARGGPSIIEWIHRGASGSEVPWRFAGRSRHQE